MTNSLGLSPLRLLPWTTDDGKPCYLSSDDRGGFMSRLADDIEHDQTDTGAEVLEHVRAVLADTQAESGKLRGALVQSAQALDDVLRIAESRGARLPAPDDDEDGPHLSDDVFE